MEIKWNPIFAGLFLITVSVSAIAMGGVMVDAGKCRIVVSEKAASANADRKGKFVWDGACLNGVAHGPGTLRRYEFGKLMLVSKMVRKNGEIFSFIESYSRMEDGSILTNNFTKSAQTTQQKIPPSQVPAWAREIVDDKPRPPTPTQVPAWARDEVNRALSASAQTAQAAPPSSASNKPKGSAAGAGSADYRNYIGWVTSSTVIFAAPYVVSDQNMLRGLVGRYRELLAGNPTEAAMQTIDCPNTSGRGPYVALVHFQNPGGKSAVGVACAGGSSPEEAYRATCSSNPICADSGSGREYARYIIIIDRRIAVGRSTYAEPAVGVVTQESTFKYRPGEKVSFSEKYNFSEGYVCHWQKDPYGSRFQMVTNGPFTRDFSSPRGRYDFNCGSKG